MKTIDLKIIFILILLVASTFVFSNTGVDTTKIINDIDYNPLEEIQKAYNAGLTDYNIGDYLTAEKEFIKASKLAKKLDEKEILSYSYHYLGNIESWKSNFSLSIYYHQKARSIFLDLNNSEYHAISNNQISISFASLGKYDSCLVYYQKNIQNREFIEAKHSVFNSYQKIAITYAHLYNYKLAYHYLQEAIKYAEEAGNIESLGEIYFTAGRLFLTNHVNKDIALEYLLQAQKIFKDSKNYRYLNLVKLNIGKVYLKTGNDSTALRQYQEVSTNLYPDDYAMLSKVDHEIALVYIKSEDYHTALKYLQKSIEEMCLICPEIQIHQTLIEAGRISLILGLKDESILYLNRAKKIAMEAESKLKMAISFGELGKYQEELNNIDSTIYYYNLAYQLEQELGLPKRVKKTAELLSKKYYAIGAYQTASDYLKIVNEMNDSLSSIEKYNELAKLEMRFEIEKREAERTLESRLLQTEITKQILIRNSFIAGALLLIGIGLMIWRAYNNKKKDMLLLAEQKNKILKISQQLQQSSQRKLNFFTNISHEIRTPLTLIKAPLENILRSKLSDQETNIQLQLAIKNTNKLKVLVNQILDLQKLDENLLSLDVSEFEIISFCSEIAASFKSYALQNNCNFRFEANITKAIIIFDQIRLHSIITNILSNAFKFNKEFGQVLFKLEISNDQFILDIKDTGIGIGHDHLKKLGERYYQIENSQANIEGSGIGLAYVKEIVALAKGKFEVSSTPGIGTHISIYLPLEWIEIQDKTPIKLEMSHINPQEYLLDNLLVEPKDHGLAQILIIEDHPDLRIFLRDLFAPSYQVICAKDGEEGKQLALKYLPDLILSDVMMPNIQGNELCKLLKTNINTSHITIILFTAKGEANNIIDGYNCGADDYIVKPFDTELLLKKVKNILSTAENARKKFRFTDIERSKNTYSDFDRKFLEDCMSIIKNQLHDTHFTVEILAENLSMHRRTLLRKFKALTDKSPIDLIRHTRMTQAAKLLKEKYRVNEVALMVGYEDSSRFSQAFKQFHNIPPSAYK